MLQTAKRYREIALSLLKYADETGINGPRDACIALAVLYQAAARDIEEHYQGRRASTSQSGAVDRKTAEMGEIAA